MKTPLENNLVSEIEFWQSLIDDSMHEKDNTVLVRINEALALAEFKLKQLTNANSKTIHH